jgi:TetR/AcrR family transcriptional repressor of nem operon
MTRKKQYIEEEVIEKAMNLFWRNGYETTSTRMLEKEMGINQFSIYSSFGNKQGVLVESMKCYQRKIKSIVDKLRNAEDGVDSIKQYFYDFLSFSKESKQAKGCLLANISSELGENADEAITNEIRNYTLSLKALFLNKLKQHSSKSEEILEKQANYLIVSMTGLAVTSKVYSERYLSDFIENTFANI